MKPFAQQNDRPALTALCFFLPLGLYGFTAARTVQGGDSGEFGLLGMLGGVAHPPGYPLYTLLAHAAGALPIDPPFFRIALASALCAAVAVAVLQRVAWRLTGNAFASTVTALIFAVSSLQWRLAGVPEVFALHALVVATTLLCALRLVDAERDEVQRDAVIFGLVLGLGMSNHLTLLLCGPLVLAAPLAVARRFGWRCSLNAMGLMTLAGFVGLTPYLLLLRWSQLDPTHAWIWGQTGTLHGLISHIRREEFGTFQLYAGPATHHSGHYILACLSSIARQYAYVLVLLGLAGMGLIFQRSTAFAIGLLGSLLLAAIVFPALMNLPRTAVDAEVTERFFLMPAVLFAPLVAVGLAAVEQWVHRVPLMIVMGVVLVTSGLLSATEACWRRDTIIERYLLACVRNLPPNAITLGRSDTIYAGMGWVSRVMQVRPDVKYIDVSLLTHRWYFDEVIHDLEKLPGPTIPATGDLGQLATSLSQRSPTFVFPWIVPDVRRTAKLEPNGFLYRVVARDTPPLPLKEFEARLDRDMALLGDATPVSIDAWAEKVHQVILFPWADLLNAYQAAGKLDKVKELQARANALVPPDSPDDIDEALGE
jgi:hypothetical protein